MTESKLRCEEGGEVVVGTRRQRTRTRKNVGRVRMLYDQCELDAMDSWVWQPTFWSPSEEKRLNGMLHAKLEECAPRPEDQETIDTCLDELKSVLPNLGGASDWSLSLFGSAANGFGTRGSDIDVTCLSEACLPLRAFCCSDPVDRGPDKDQKDGDDRSAADERDASTEAREESGCSLSSEDGVQDAEAEAPLEPPEALAEVLPTAGEAERKPRPLPETPQALLRERWCPALESHPRFQVVEEVLWAKVPVLKIQFDKRVDVDLSVQNVGALQNTKLLLAYANVHPIVRELVIAVKLWAKGAGVCGAAKGHLSSYAFTLLTIYYLQVSENVQLPCLPTSVFQNGGAGLDDERVKVARETVSIRSSTVELLCEFFCFYTLYFVWGREVVCTRLGVRRSVDDPLFEKLQGRWSGRVHIEDPYFLPRNLHCVLGCREELQLRAAFTEAMQGLGSGFLPRSLLPSSTNDAEEHLAAAMAKLSTADVTTTSCDDLANGSGAEVSSFSDDDEQHREPAKEVSPWWRNLGSAKVRQALGEAPPVGRARLLVAHDLEKLIRGQGERRCITVQDLEESIGESAAVPRSLLSSGFVSQNTRGIAARVNQFCMQELRRPVQLQ